MTIADERNIRIALNGWVGPVGSLLWAYLALCLGRALTSQERDEIVVMYFGHKTP